MSSFSPIVLALVLAIVALAAIPASADVAPPPPRKIVNVLVLSWEGEELEGTSVFFRAWRVNQSDDDPCVPVESGVPIEDLDHKGIDVYAVKGALEDGVEPTRAVLSEIDGFAVAKIKIAGFASGFHDPIHQRTTHMSIKAIKDGEIEIETTRVVETDSLGNIIRDTGEDSEDDGEGSGEGSDDDGIPLGDEFGYTGSSSDTATILLALTAVAAIGLAITLVTRFRA